MTAFSISSPALRPSGQVLAKRLGQDAVLVHISTNRIFELNETGTRVWELLGQGLKLDQIASRLVDEFDVEAAQVTDEVTDLIAQLRAADLIVC